MRFYLARKLPAGYAAVPLPYKLFMLFGVIFIAIVFIYYTQLVVNQLKEKTRQDVELYVGLYQVALNDETSGIATNLIFERVISSVSFPIIFADADLEPQYWKELEGVPDGMAPDADSASLRKVRAVLADLAAQGRSVEIVSNNRLFYRMFYGDPKLVRQLQLMPFVEVSVIAIFILVGFMGFRNIKRSEQRNIWVGMAKETAHQLGTPLSGLLGWLELLRSRLPAEPNVGESEDLPTAEILSRMEADINRLERIANRFSLIGSTPALTSVDMEDILSDAVEYFRRRLPHSGNGLKILFERYSSRFVKVNRELISWVFENLIKNALEACDSVSGVVQIKSDICNNGKTVCIEVVDNGRGMSPAEVKKVFQPGYTSKKRGWGLGLTLAHRIVEEYHRGHIFVKDSSLGNGTTFRIELPLADDSNAE
ncbi:MAG: HAMP domain-containing sensor histidine kinase [Candidatus Zixiibacteriota bacterium]